MREILMAWDLVSALALLITLLAFCGSSCPDYYVNLC
jgi:hypothetical protein